MSRVEMEQGWQPKVNAALAKLFEEKLGPDITADAVRYAPVGPSRAEDPAHPRTPPHEGGELKASISFHMDDRTLVVRADAPYAADVECGTVPHVIAAHGDWSLWSPEEGYLGHEVNHPGTKPQSFLRRALMTERGGE
jgi:hypothetical protein